mmetsp:Transcript_6100/g.7497  ORF Transcript_6100/g.7497 Transcript_6100/m.7497 type:complete len:283 (+) Transcript_6100:348-1196(+)
MQVVLVAVNADGQDAFVCCGLQNANTGAACRCIDNVSALADLCLGQLGALDRVVPCCRGGAGHVGDHGGVRVHGFYAFSVAAGELADQRDVHAADETNGAGLGCLGCQHANQIRAFVLVEDNRADVRCINNHVDDDEFGVRIITGNLTQRISKGKACHYDRVSASFCETAQSLLALCFGLQFDFTEALAGFFCPTLRAGKGRLVEGFVELAAEVKDQRRFCQSCTCTQRYSGCSAHQGFHQGHQGYSQFVFLVTIKLTVPTRVLEKRCDNLGRSGSKGSTVF